MILDVHYQKCLSHDLINDISYQNASAVTSEKYKYYIPKINLITEAWTRKSQPWLLWWAQLPP